MKKLTSYRAITLFSTGSPWVIIFSVPNMNSKICKNDFLLTAQQKSSIFLYSIPALCLKPSTLVSYPTRTAFTIFLATPLDNDNCPTKTRFQLVRKYDCHARFNFGGVYKTRERIHRNLADFRLLPIPRS